MNISICSETLETEIHRESTGDLTDHLFQFNPHVKIKAAYEMLQKSDAETH